MNMSMTDSLAGLVPFFSYFAVSLVLLALFCLIYGKITPYPEIRLIKEGKVAPAISMGGAVLGFVIPVASAISHSVNFIDMVIWAVVALLVQIALFLVLKTMMSGLVGDIQDDHVAPATLLAALSVATGILAAASMSY
jgi:putative membrane protein